ncbi:MAG: hypothetical protein KF773_28510 [Deltaproteobacteria bacterium]|nr:hypothetical protein [Deltaproteobacteria bacterium]
MRVRAGLLVFLLACGADDDGPVGPIGARITHYDYRFDLDSLAAHATVTAAVETAGNCISLPFRAEGFAADTAKVDGAAPKAGSTLDGSTLTLCGPGHAAGETMTLDVDLAIPRRTLSTSQVGFSIKKDAQDNPFYYLVSWVNGCDQFGPCDSAPSAFATYTFHVTHPDGIMVRCPGAITEVSPTETTCDFTADGGPTYSTFGVAAYPAAAWPQTDKGMWGSTHAIVYDRPGTNVAAAIDPAYHDGFVKFMESTFGPYPFGGELRILTAPTYWSGFEHPGNIILADTLARGGSSYLHPVAHVLDHEIAHMWAGDQTTLAATYDFVWKEAMAEYLSYVYEDMADRPAANATVAAWKSFSSSATFFPVPGEKPELFDYYGDAYGPGPMILFRQLEVLTSREQVIAALKTVLGRPRALSVDELVAALAQATGLDLTEYANAWLKGTGVPAWPRIALTFTPGAAGTSTLQVTQTNPSKRTCKFSVMLVGAPGETALVAVDTFRNGTTQTIDVPTPAFTVTQTVLDPLRECLVFPSNVSGPNVEAPSSLQPRRAIEPWRTAPSAM